MSNVQRTQHTQQTIQRLMSGPQSFRFRLNAVAFAGQRKGKSWK